MWTTVSRKSRSLRRVRNLERWQDSKAEALRGPKDFLVTHDIKMIDRLRGVTLYARLAIRIWAVGGHKPWPLRQHIEVANTQRQRRADPARQKEYEEWLREDPMRGDPFEGSRSLSPSCSASSLRTCASGCGISPTRSGSDSGRYRVTRNSRSHSAGAIAGTKATGGTGDRRDRRGGDTSGPMRQQTSLTAITGHHPPRAAVDFTVPACASPPRDDFAPGRGALSIAPWQSR